MEIKRTKFWLPIILGCIFIFGVSQALAAGLTFNDPAKMSDMSDFDPSNPVIPEGDTIKIAIVASFSGPAAIVGQIYYVCAQWAAHDINKRGGIMVDGKRKKVQIIKANHESKPAIAKKVCERMVLQEKVHVLWAPTAAIL